MVNSIKVYFKIIILQFKCQMQYPINAFVGFINQFIVLMFEFIAMWALFDRFNQVDGWSFNEVFFTYGIINLSFSMAETLMRGFESDMTYLVRHGEYDRYLLRPLDTIYQISAFNFQVIRLGRVFQSLAILLAGVYLNLESVSGIEWIILIITILGGILLYFSLYIISGIISFKLIQYTEFMSIFIHGSVSTMQYPMIIFPKWIQRIFTYIIPATTITYYPIAALLGKKLDIPQNIAYTTPIVCYIFFIISILIFKRIEKSYVSSGN